MKKFIVCLMLAFIGIFSASAQVVDNGSIKDNWYLGGGIGTQIWNNQNSWKYFDPIKDQQLNINIYGGKYFTPYLGAELSTTALFNTGAEKNFIDGHLVSLSGVANLSNIFVGHTRFFEVEAIVGRGWYHAYMNGKDYNHSAFRGALRGNFKIAKNLKVYVIPEYVSLGNFNNHFNMCPHGVNLYVGVKWNIPSVRGGFPVLKLYDYEEVAQLNDHINILHATLEKKPKIVEVVKSVNIPLISVVENVYTVHFDKGSYTVGDISKIAEVLNCSNTDITIIGSTSPEGSESLNKKLALDRANAVADALVKAGVSRDRITTTNDYTKQRNATIIVGK